MNRADLCPPHFAADQAGCPTCKLELVPHPDGGRWLCPLCKYERATMRATAVTVSTRPAIAAVLKVMTETLETVRPIGGKVDEQTTPADDAGEALDPAPGPAWISVIDLAKRWGVSVYVATHRLRENDVPSLRELNGKLVVDRADVARWPTEAPPAKRVGYGSGNGHSAEAVKPEPAPTPAPLPSERLDAPSAAPAEPPSAERPRPTEAASAPAETERPRVTAPLYGNDAGRVRRLLLALERINGLAIKYSDDVWILPAIAALASYAIEAES